MVPSPVQARCPLSRPVCSSVPTRAITPRLRPPLLATRPPAPFNPRCVLCFARVFALCAAMLLAVFSSGLPLLGALHDSDSQALHARAPTFVFVRQACPGF